MKREKKPESEKSGRTNIAMPPAVKKKGKLLRKMRGDTTFSGMLAALIKEEYDRRASLSKKLAVFIAAFKRVFSEDWDYSQMILYHTHNRGRKFIELNEYDDWAAHDALIHAYRALVEEEAKQRIPDWESDL